MVKQVKSFAEYTEALNGSKPVIVDYFATWCGPCKVVAPQFEKLSGEFTDVEFIKVDIDEVPEAAQAAKVTAMPTFKLFRNGTEAETVIGANIQKLKLLAQQAAAF